MTNAVVYSDKEIKSVNVYGHSGYAERGEDIVCAAVSSLCDSFVHLCIAYELQDKISILESDSRAGYALMRVRDTYGVLDSAIDMLTIGYKAISEQYKNNFSFTRLEY